MAQHSTNGKQQAHELIEKLAPRQVAAVVDLLEAMLDPVSRAIANAPIDDEPENEKERRAVTQSKDWFQKNQPAEIPHDEILAEFGLSPKDLKDSKDRM